MFRTVSLIFNETMHRSSSDDAQHEIGLAHQYIRIAYFRECPDSRSELVKVGAAVCIQAHLGEYMSVEAYLSSIHERNAAANDAFSFETFDPTPSRRCTQSHLGGELCHSLTAIALKLAQDPALGLGKLDHLCLTVPRAAAPPPL